jgi:RNA polymerase sigma factor (sigma-70 family)
MDEEAEPGAGVRDFKSRRMAPCDCPPFDCAGLVRLYLAGDRHAGDELAEKFTPLVRAIVQRVLGSEGRQDWDDVSQAIFYRVFARLDTWEERCPFCKWLAVVAARRAIDFTRTPARMGRLPGDVPDTRPPPPDPEIMACIERTVAQFPSGWRELWDLWLQGTKREEMARRLGKSVRTVQYWLAEMSDQLLHCLPG